MRLLIRIPIFFVFLSSLLQVSTAARAQSNDAPNDSKSKIVLLGQSSTKERLEEISDALSSEFSGLDEVDFELVWVDSFPAELSAQRELANTSATEHLATVVMWCEPENFKSIYFRMGDSDSEIFLTRNLEGVSEDSIADAVSIIASETLESFIANATNSPKKEPPPEPVAPEPTETEPVTNVSLAAGAGYALKLISGTHAPINGAHFYLALRFKDTFGLGAGYYLLQPITDHSDDVDLEVRRHPFFLELHAAAPLGRFSLGGSVSFLFDYATWDQEATTEVPESVEPPSSSWRFSFIPAILAEFRIAGPLSAYANLGVEIHQDMVSYDIENGETLLGGDLWRIQPSFNLGVKITFF